MPSLRTKLLLALMAIVALLAVIPAAHRWTTWAPHREALDEWAAGLERQPNSHESWSVKLNGQSFSVHTSEIEIDPDGVTWNWSGQPIQPQGFYVVPPGEWVEDVPEVDPVAHRFWKRLDVGSPDWALIFHNLSLRGVDQFSHCLLPSQ